VKKRQLINAGGKLLSTESPLVMGIINVTPDSFYKRSRLSTEEEVMNRVSKMIEDGASIIDIGGISTRPGASPIAEEEERSRVIGHLKLLRREFPLAVFSIDTYRAEIAREAFYEAGINMINDISGGTIDANMLPLVREINIPYIMMHISGTPENMQNSPVYDDVVSDIIKYFGNRVPPLLEAGVKDIIIDPGIGFGKTIEQNFIILSRLAEFSVIGLPVMLGLSRKSLIWKTLEVLPDEALNGTTALNMTGLMNGADILRVHDVAEAVQTIRLFEKMRKNEGCR
jgi:dihydropteroate synthase